MAKNIKNPMIAAATVSPTQSVDSKSKELPEPRNHAILLGKSYELAQSEIHYKNARFNNASKHFPHDPLARTVDKFFPYAKDGALYIDEPTEKVDVSRCIVKAGAMIKENMRYAFIVRNKETSEEQVIWAKEAHNYSQKIGALLGVA